MKDKERKVFVWKDNRAYGVKNDKLLKDILIMSEKLTDYEKGILRMYLLG